MSKNPELGQGVLQILDAESSRIAEQRSEAETIKRDRARRAATEAGFDEGIDVLISHGRVRYYTQDMIAAQTRPVPVPDKPGTELFLTGSVNFEYDDITDGQFTVQTRIRGQEMGLFTYTGGYDLGINERRVAGASVTSPYRQLDPNTAQEARKAVEFIRSSLQAK